jgi:ankyrin repeat protein
LKSSQVEEFTELHELINDKHFHLALDMLKTAKVDANILAIAPKNCQKGAGNSALHFLAFSGSSKHVDKKAVQALADILCPLCAPLLNHRNELGKMALHTAASHGNHILVKALLDADAGIIFTFILTLTLNYS